MLRGLYLYVFVTCLHFGSQVTTRSFAGDARADLRNDLWYLQRKNGGFLKWGYPQIIHIDGFSLAKTIYGGSPMTMETPKWRYPRLGPWTPPSPGSTQVDCYILKRKKRLKTFMSQWRFLTPQVVWNVEPFQVKRAASKCEFVHVCMKLFVTAAKYAAIKSASDRTTVSRRRWSSYDVFCPRQRTKKASAPQHLQKFHFTRIY